MSQSIELEGLEKTLNMLSDYNKNAQKRIKRAVNINALEFQRTVKKSIQRDSGRYRLYHRWNKGHQGKRNGVRRGVKHWSSRPGAPPNTDQGDLVRSINITKRSTGRRYLSFIRAGAKYARPLEFGIGGANPGVIRKAKRYSTGKHARPFMVPVLLKKNKLFRARIKEAVRGARG